MYYKDLFNNPISHYGARKKSRIFFMYLCFTILSPWLLIMYIQAKLQLSSLCAKLRTDMVKLTLLYTTMAANNFFILLENWCINFQNYHKIYLDLNFKWINLFYDDFFCLRSLPVVKYIRYIKFFPSLST